MKRKAIIVEEGSIEGFACLAALGEVEDRSVITLMKNNGKWSVGCSMALPSNIEEARKVLDAYNKAFEALASVQVEHQSDFAVNERVITTAGCRLQSPGGYLTITKVGKKWREFPAVMCRKVDGSERLYLEKNLRRV